MDFVGALAWTRALGEGHEVDEGSFALVRLKGGAENVGIRKIFLVDLMGLYGRYPEMSALFVVQYGGEDAGRIEAGEAAPVYGTIGAHQSS